MAAVQDWWGEPEGSPVKGSKYSAKPPEASCSRVACRGFSALSGSSRSMSECHSSQLTTGQAGPASSYGGGTLAPRGKLGPAFQIVAAQNLRRVARYVVFVIFLDGVFHAPTSLRSVHATIGI